MGCTASSPANFIGQHQNPISESPSSHSNFQFQSPYSSFSHPNSTPVSRTLHLPTPLIHHPPMRKGDSNHFVSLTSTTYGSLVLVDPPNPRDFENPTAQKKRVQDFGNSEDPLSPDSVINTWELMEGLDGEESNFYMVDFPKKLSNIEMDTNEIVESYEFVEYPVSKPLWKHLSEETLLVKMDNNVVSSYPKAVPKDNHKLQKAGSLDLNDCEESCNSLCAENRIVLYYTSLRGIRKTYEDCSMVRLILQSFSVCVDERDISMDKSYRTELQDALKGKAMSLPHVFINGKHIGGAEEIKQLNEGGELAKLLEGFPLMDSSFMCESCGDARFVPCPNCNGSRKVYEEGELEMRRCPDCNENGLIRCSSCCP